MYTRTGEQGTKFVTIFHSTLNWVEHLFFLLCLFLVFGQPIL